MSDKGREKLASLILKREAIEAMAGRDGPQYLDTGIDHFGSDPVTGDRRNPVGFHLLGRPRTISGSLAAIAMG